MCVLRLLSVGLNCSGEDMVCCVVSIATHCRVIVQMMFVLFWWVTHDFTLISGDIQKQLASSH